MLYGESVKKWSVDDALHIFTSYLNPKMIKNSSIGIRGICPDGRISQDNLQAKALWQWIEEFQASGPCGAKVGSLKGACGVCHVENTVRERPRSAQKFCEKSEKLTADGYPWESVGASVAMTCGWLVSCYNHGITLL